MTEPVSRNHKPGNRKRLKRELWERDKGICQLCAGTIRIWEQCSLDRVIPGAQGGRYTLDNLQAAHSWCNSRKGDTVVAKFAYAPLDRLQRLLAEGRIEWTPVPPASAAGTTQPGNSCP